MPGRQLGDLRVLCWLTMATASPSSRGHDQAVAELRTRFFRALFEHLGLPLKRDLPAALTTGQRLGLWKLCMTIWLDPGLDPRSRQLAKVLADLTQQAVALSDMLVRAAPELEKLSWTGAMKLPPEERMRLNKARADALARAFHDLVERSVGRGRGRPENPRTSIEGELRAQGWGLEEIVKLTDMDAGDPVKRARGRTDAWRTRMEKEARALQAEAGQQVEENQVKQIAPESET
jgi:hypothetical protein